MPANWPQRIEKQYRLLDEADTTIWNKKTIRWFVEHYKPVSYNRKDKYIRYLREIALLLGKSFNEMQKDDVGRLIQALEKRFPEEWTFVDCKKMLKTFFRFYLDDIADTQDKKEEYVRLVPVLKAVNRVETCYRRHRQKKLVILAKEEVKKLFKVASDTVRELAIVTFLYHTAARPSEFLNMTVGDTEINGEGTLYFTVTGKTGTRKLPLAADETAIQVLLDWINQHRRGSDKQTPLWLNRSGKRLSLSALSLMLRRLSNRAGVRRITPKLLRKAKLSHMADDGYNAYQIKKYAGHSTIETAMFYVELSQEGFEQAIKKQYGTRDRKQALLQPKKCWKCGYVNRPFHTRCRECGKVLDPEEAFKELKERSDLITSVMPQEMLDQLIEFVAEKLRDRTRVSKGHPQQP